MPPHHALDALEMMAETKKRKNDAISDSNDLIDGFDAQCQSPAAPGRKPSADAVVKWLHILLDPAMDREPEEFYLERNVLRKYREANPNYSIAARSWHLYAEQYWDTVGPIVKQLFARHFNFMQWALEYARETYPDIYGSQSLSNDAILDLTDVLYDRTFSPLHISAALGLEPVCFELMEKPDAPGVMFKDRAASPLFCSLAGPQIFTCGTSMEKWHKEIHLHYPELRSRLPVIQKLLELHLEGRVVYESTGRKGRLLMFLAFRAAVLTGDHSILKLVVQGGGDVRAVIDLINDDEFAYYPGADLTTRSNILSSILDLVLAPSKLNLVERDRQALIDAMQDAFLLIGGARFTSGSVDISDTEFQEALKDAFLDDSIICFRRLIHHPSFDPNAPALTGLANGTLLHHAVCDGLVEFADVIVESGGNLEARDHMGRTPLLLCNDTESLAMLVKEHGAKTTAVDHEGRNIWHYAAATNDVPILMWLAGHDASKLENLKAKTKHDATPMDLAMTSGLESLDANEKTRLDATIVLQVLLSNSAPHAEEIDGMTAEVAIKKILKNHPRPVGEGNTPVSALGLHDSFA